MDRLRLELIKGASVLDVSDEVFYVWEGFTGFGMPPLHRQSERGPQQHGDTDRGYSLDPRLVNLVIVALGDDWNDVYAHIDQLNNYFHPASPTTLRYLRPDGRTFHLDVFADGRPPFYDSTDIIGHYAVRVGMTLKANDPAWYDPTARSLTFSLGGGGDVTTVPTAVPTGVGASTIDQSIPVRYKGSWIAYPVIKIVGPITNPVIKNESTGGHLLDFTGTTIGVGEWFEIELRYGNKVIRNQAGVYQNGKLVDPNDLALFGFYPDPEAPDGINSIRVTGTGINENSHVDFSWLDRYL